MPTHAEKRFVPFRPGQMFDLVAAIDRYPEFLPWCLAARIRGREGDVVTADLVIGWGMIRERFTSRVTLTHPVRVDVEYIEGPLAHLNNHWVFEPARRGAQEGCTIDFFVDFEFRSRLLQKAIGALFGEAVKRMVAAFESRAHALYGVEAEAPRAT